VFFVVSLKATQKANVDSKRQKKTTNDKKESYSYT
jgi:hypothetical protein